MSDDQVGREPDEPLGRQERDAKAVAEVEQQILQQLGETPSITLGELRQKLAVSGAAADDPSLLSLALLRLVNRGEIILTPERRLELGESVAA